MAKPQPEGYDDLVDKVSVIKRVAVDADPESKSVIDILRGDVLWVHRQVDAQHPLDPERIAARLVLEEADGTVVEMPTSGRPPVANISAVLTERWVVWTETQSTRLDVAAWTMFAFDRSSGVMRELYTTPPVHGDAPPQPPAWTGPVVVGDRVYWADVGSKRPRNWIKDLTVDIVGCDIEACEPEAVAGSSAVPFRAGDELCFVTSEFFAANRKVESSQVHCRDRKGGDEVVHRLDYLPLSVSGSQTHLVWADKRDRLERFVIRDRRSGEETVIEAEAKGQCFTEPEATRRYVIWSDGNCGDRGPDVSGYFHHVETGRTYTFGTERGFGSFEVDGSTFAWQERTKSKTRRKGSRRVEWVFGDLTSLG